MNNSTRQAVTAALMAGFFMVANGLALAWTLTSDGAHMRRGFVIVMIAISTALLPAMMSGPFSPPLIAASRLSSRSLPFCFSDPWHLKQDFSNIGLMSFS